MKEETVDKVFIVALLAMIAVVATLASSAILQYRIAKNGEAPSPSPLITPKLSPSPPLLAPTPIIVEALNWAGYVVASNLQNPQPTVTSISASWAVPAVSPSTNPTYSAIWIGIGGKLENDSTLIQCGTEQDSNHGRVAYYVWYELLPKSSITITSITVSPGDQMQASIQLVNAISNQWVISITDTTSGQSFQNTVNYASSQLSAEWIVERPTVNGVTSQLANFGSITFTDCFASIGSVTGGISSFPSNAIVMYSSITRGSPSVQLTDTSDLTPDGAGFTVTYLASG